MINKKTGLRAVTTLAGASVLLAGCTPAVPPAEQAADSVSMPAVVAEAPQMEASALTGMQVSRAEAQACDKIANVTGTFTFDQETITPSDEIFSLFGTAATALCAKPGFAFEEADREDYYVNVGGTIKKAYSLNLAAIADMEPTTRTMSCSCGHGPAVANASVTGVKLADVLQLAKPSRGW